MAKSIAPILLLGAGALLLVGRKKGASSGSPEEPGLETRPTPTPTPVPKKENLVEVYEAETPEVGHFYQIRKGDTLALISREALFGSREAITNPKKRQAVMDLMARIECVPWNQRAYGRPADELDGGHVAVENGWSNLGVSFLPIYAPNRKRISGGLAPSGAPGNSHAFIWIPMINLDIFDSAGVVTVEGMNWPDTEDGIGYSMIDAPPEVMKLRFEEEKPGVFGCELSEGDLKRGY